jgi:hypothetical protein
MSRIISNVYVKIWSDNTEAHLTVSYGDIKNIGVYIPIRQFEYTPLSIYNSKIMRDFISLIDGCNVTELEQMNDIPNTITTIFIEICKQISSKIPISSLTDIRGMKLSDTYTIYKNGNNRNEFKEFVTNIASSVLTHVGQELIQSSIMPNIINNNQQNRFNINESNNRQGISTVTQNTNRLSTPTVPPLLSMFLSRPIQSRINELDHKQISTNTRNMVSNIISHNSENSENIPYALDHGHEHEHEEDANIPNRFSEIPNNHREIIITNATSMPYLEEKKYIEENIVENSGDSTNIHPSSAQISQLPHMLTKHKQIDSEIVKKYAFLVHKLIQERKTKHPNFNNLTRSGIRKIKNYLHNVSHLWFSQDEIIMFIEEFKKL